MILHVNSIYDKPTFQGEGRSGDPCFFLRLAGCNLKCGFCFAKGSTVLMADWTQRPIETIQEGDLVMSYRNRQYVVSKVVKTYQREAETIKVKTEVGDVVSTPDHVFHTNHHLSGRKKCPASDLQGRWIKRSKLGLYSAQPFSEDYFKGYLQGAYAGDGSSSSWGGYVKIYFQVIDLDFAERLQDIINSHGRKTNITISKRLTVAGNQVYRVSCALTSIEFILDFPKNDEQARGYIAGFFDAEGTVGNGQLSISQKDAKLLHRVEDILSGFKFETTFSTDAQGQSELTINGLDNCERFMAMFTPAIQRKANRQRNNLNRMLAPIEVVGVELQGVQPVYNVMTTIGNLFVNGFLVDQCDTPYTWDWTGVNGTAYDKRLESVPLEVSEVFDRLTGLSYQYAHIKRLVISGGEPLLQQTALIELTTLLHAHDWHTEIETAGTIAPLFNLAHQYNVSPKLANSGNPLDRRLRPDALYALVNSKRALFKFVVCEPSDLVEIDELVNLYQLRPVYLMPEGTTVETLRERATWVAAAALERGYCYSPRLHIELYGNVRNR